MNIKLLPIYILFCFFYSFNIFAQNSSGNASGGSVNGNFQMDVQYYEKDEQIDAEEVPEKMLMNTFGNVIYTNNAFSAGLRYEAYQNPILGFDKRYQGNGIPYLYVQYSGEKLDMTLGSYYEQFGNGLIFRSYEERNLGIDNAMDGVRIKFNPAPGVRIKGVYGKQRYFFEKGEGIVRGIDGEFSLNESFATLADKKTRLIFGGSAVSKYQKDESEIYVFPENVAAFAGRLNVFRGAFSVSSEYAYKINDPSASNSLIYKPGQALFLNTNYATRGFGMMLSALRVDNMDYRSDRTVTGNPLTINYLPALSKQHAYTLAAMYPNATQPNGQMALQGEVFFTAPKKSLLGGKYGTAVSLFVAMSYDIEKNQINDTISIGESGTDGYKSDFLSIGETKFFQEIGLEVKKKFSKSLKGVFSAIYQEYNEPVLAGHGSGIIHSTIGVVDLTYKITTKQALRTEIQNLFTEDDKGDWAFGLLEYTISPHWFFAIMDQYNYGNEIKDDQHHYFMVSSGYIHKTSRIALSYGKQREGILCVGGVCREVPASSGLMLSITSSF